MVEFRFCSKCNKVFESGTKCSYCSGSLDLKEPSFFIGRSFGKYQIEDLLGFGGMGLVYLARHSILNRLSALKVVLPSLEKEEIFIERFLKEAQLLARLKHPNIVGVYDFDISEYGIAYYAMEYVEGVNLRTILSNKLVRLQIEHFKEVLSDIASALDYAHSIGVIHRDLKPENIILFESGEKVTAKIVDFGIAKLLTSAASRTLTGEGNIVGTLNYIAPEQVLSTKVSPKTDLYSFALIVAEIVLGKPVREGKSFYEIISKDIREPLRRDIFPHGTNEDIIKGLEKATQPEEEKRQESVSEFVNDLNLNGTASLEKLREIISSHKVSFSPTLVTSQKILSQLSKKRSLQISSKLEIPKKKFSFLKLTFALLFAFIALFSFLLIKKSYVERGFNQFSLEEEYSVLSDTIALLSSPKEDTLLMRGGSSFYYFKLGQKVIPSTIQFKENEKFIATSQTGNPIFLKDNKIVEYIIDDGSERVIFDATKFKPDEVFFSDSNRTLCLKKDYKFVFYSLFSSTFKEVSSINLKESNISDATLSDNYFAVRVGNKIIVIDIESKKEVFSKNFTEKIYGFKICDILNCIIIFGWFDKIIVGSLTKEEVNEIQIKGEIFDAILLPEKNLLCSCGSNGFFIYDLTDLKLLYKSKENIPFQSIIYSAKGFFLLSREKSLIARYTLRDSAPLKTLRVSEKSIWAIDEDRKNGYTFFGGSDGNIYYIDEKGNIGKKDTHSLGVTFLLNFDNFLISSSDDKTIAVFSLPDIELKFRSKAHNFLINWLTLSNNKGIWSSSSDGYLKEWTIPELNEVSSISIREITKRKASLHSFWVSKDNEKFLVGSWNHFLCYLKRDKNNFVCKLFEVPSMASISMVELPSINSILILGSYDLFSLYLFDLESEKLYILPPINSNDFSFYLCKEKEEDLVFFPTLGKITQLKIEKDENGFTYSSKTAFIKEIEYGGAILDSFDGKTIIIGKENGEVLFISKDVFNLVEGVKGRISREILPSKLF